MSTTPNLPSVAPQRIKLSRAKDYRKPTDVVVVSRPSRWGNPFRYRDKTCGLVRYQPSLPSVFEYEGRISAHGMSHPYYHPDGHIADYRVRWATRAEIVELFRRTLLKPDRGMLGAYPSAEGRFLKVTVEDVRRELAGRDLACWCPVDQPCHADVLLEVANAAEVVAA